jgi:sugar O-acyltransferase (sialic acid O-acetyltransferase NeuD family)
MVTISSFIMRNIVIYGAGGYGKEVVCLIREINRIQERWKILGFIDDGLPYGASNQYGKVLGGISVLQSWKEQLDVVLAIGNPSIQAKIASSIVNPNLEFPNIIAPEVLFLDYNTISLGKGNIIGFKSIISCNVNFGDFNILNLDVLLGHDTKIGNFNIFSPSVRISGQVKIGNENLFGISSVVLQNKKIGNNNTISANSVVIRNTQDNSLYLGNPAIKMKL